MSCVIKGTAKSLLNLNQQFVNNMKLNINVSNDVSLNEYYNWLVIADVSYITVRNFVGVCDKTYKKACK